MPKPTLKLAAPIALLAAVVLLHYGGGVDFVILSETERVPAYGPAGTLFFLCFFILSGSLFMPPAIMTVAAGIIWPFEAALLIALTGCTATAVLGFTLSRHVARDFCSRHIPAGLCKYNEGLREHGLKTTILLRLLFFLFPPVNWMLGVSRLRFRDYILGTILGALPGVVLYTYVGDGLVPWLLAEPYPRIPAALGILAAGILAIGFAGKRLRSGHGENDQGPCLSPGLFARSVFGFIRLARTAYFPPRRGGRQSFRRYAVMAAFIPAFGFLQAAHWVALLLDELLYPSYRSVRIEAPLFIVGIPRSGTTLLQRVLAEDEQRFTTTQLWEALFAPAVCQRKLLCLAARCDRLVGRPLGKYGSRFASRVAEAVNDIHRLSLQRPEEDFLLLMPILSCFALIAPFPQARNIKDLGYFDTRVPENRRREVMAFYRGMLRRHLYFHGSGCTILSKNPSFTPMLGSLVSAFPDAKVVVCVRTPLNTVPSQISSMHEAWRFFGNPTDAPDFRDRWVDLLRHYYRRLEEFFESSGGAAMQCVEMDMLKQDLEGVVRSLYSNFDMEVGPAFAARLAKLDHDAKAYSSRHEYSLSEYGLDQETITAEFEEAWRALRSRAVRRKTVSNPGTGGRES